MNREDVNIYQQKYIFLRNWLAKNPNRILTQGNFHNIARRMSVTLWN